jgi:hypothetical protein
MHSAAVRKELEKSLEHAERGIACEPGSMALLPRSSFLFYHLPAAGSPSPAAVHLEAWCSRPFTKSLLVIARRVGRRHFEIFVDVDAAAIGLPRFTTPELLFYV